ncbi:MAG: helix-turn-helix domain-containing protein [Clostridiales bacterium]|nr:helix-turn-helix domain-containing protein [Clostridiales bacterium]
METEPGTRVLRLSMDNDFLFNMVPELSTLSLRQHHIGMDFHNDTYCSLCRNLSTLIFCGQRSDGNARLRMLTALNTMLATILNAFSIPAEQVSAANNYISERIQKILSYISEHYTEKISVGEIASHLGIHPQYFSSFFHKYFHVGFSEYLAEFRVSASINQLLLTNESILNIALTCGFSNHKTYGAAFQKLYHMPPTEYRKTHQQPVPDSTESSAVTETDPDNDIFSFFRPFFTEEFTATGIVHQKQLISFSRKTLLSQGKQKQQLHVYTIGRALTVLRQDIQAQMRQAKEDLHIDYFRVRDIFSDSLYIYHETNEKEPRFNWQALDRVFDFMLSIHAKPFPEIGYMPETLASKKQYGALQFRPNVSFPKSLRKWKQLIQNFLLHYIERYGIEEVSQWYFDFWTTPDLQMKMPYWNESMEKFFLFYKATYDVFQKVNPRLRLGSPNFSTISGYPWYTSFFRYCKKENITPAYIGFHAYGCQIFQTSLKSKDFNDIRSDDYTISNQEQIRLYLNTLHEIMDAEGFGFLSVIVSDFNLDYMPVDLIRDTSYMGAYLAHATFQTLDQVNFLGHWCLSDIYEDAYPEDSLFWGGPGFLTSLGLKKASYNALALISRAGNQILAQGDNYLLARKENTWQLFIYHLVEFENFYMNMDPSTLDSTHRYAIYTNMDDLHVNITLHFPAGSYYVRRFEVSREHGSAYDTWVQIGAPESFSKDLEDYLLDSSVPLETYNIHSVVDFLILDEKIPALGLILLEIRAKEGM